MLESASILIVVAFIALYLLYIWCIGKYRGAAICCTAILGFILIVGCLSGYSEIVLSFLNVLILTFCFCFEPSDRFRNHPFCRAIFYNGIIQACFSLFDLLVYSNSSIPSLIGCLIASCIGYAFAGDPNKSSSTSKESVESISINSPKSNQKKKPSGSLLSESTHIPSSVPSESSLSSRDYAKSIVASWNVRYAKTEAKACNPLNVSSPVKIPERSGFYLFVSQNTPGKTYTTSLLSCSCPSYNRMDDLQMRPCKHMIRLAIHLNFYEKARFPQNQAALDALLRDQIGDLPF